MGGRILLGTAWLSSARVLILLIGLVSNAFLARLLSPADFGLINFAMQSVFLVSALSDLRFGAALIQKKDPSEADLNTAWTLNVVRGLLLSSVLALLSGPLSLWAREPDAKPIMLALALVPLIEGLRNPRFILYEKRLDYRAEFVTQVGARLISLAISVVLAYYTRSAWALVYGTIASYVAQAYSTYLFSPALPRPTLSAWRGLVSFSGWLTAGALVSQINLRLDTFVIARLLGTRANGLYAQAQQIAVLPTHELAGTIGRALFPGLSSVNGDRDRTHRLYTQIQAGMLGLSLPAGLGCALFAQPLVQILLGPKWMAVVPLVQIIAPVMALQLITSGVSAVAMAHGQTRALFLLNLSYLAVRMPLFLAGVIYFGLTGAITARAIAGLFFIGLNLALAARIVKEGWYAPIARSWRTLVAAAVMTLSLLALRPMVNEATNVLDAVLLLAGGTLVGGIIYIASLLSLWRAVGCPGQTLEAEVIFRLRKLLQLIRQRRA